MKKLIFTLVLTLFCGVIFGQHGISNFHKFKSAFPKYEIACGTFNTIQTNVLVTIVFSTLGSDADNIEEGTKMVVEYTDGTKEKCMLLKLSSKRGAWLNSYYEYLNFISFFIDKESFISKQIETIHVLTKNDKDCMFESGKKWKREGLSIQRQMLNECAEDRSRRIKTNSIFDEADD